MNVNKLLPHSAKIYLWLEDIFRNILNYGYSSFGGLRNSILGGLDGSGVSTLGGLTGLNSKVPLGKEEF